MYASKYSAKFLSKRIFLAHTFNIYFMNIYNYHIKPCTCKWVCSYTCVYYPVPWYTWSFVGATQLGLKFKKKSIMGQTWCLLDFSDIVHRSQELSNTARRRCQIDPWYETYIVIFTVIQFALDPLFNMYGLIKLY